MNVVFHNVLCNIYSFLLISLIQRTDPHCQDSACYIFSLPPTLFTHLNPSRSHLYEMASNLPPSLPRSETALRRSRWPRAVGRQGLRRTGPLCRQRIERTAGASTC